jgi:Chaperone of endosialidase
LIFGQLSLVPKEPHPVSDTDLGAPYGAGALSFGTLFASGTGGLGGGPHNPKLVIKPNGDVLAAGDFTSRQVLIPSDIRLKTNITSLTNVLDKVAKMRGVSFEWNDLAESSPKGQKAIGVIAQEVEEVFPELVVSGGLGGYKTVAYGNLTGVLIEAVKELRAEKDAQITALVSDHGVNSLKINRLIS